MNTIQSTDPVIKVIKVKPRGPENGFFNQESFQKFSFSSKNKIKSDKKKVFSPTKLQFGFAPLPHSASGSVKNQHSEIYFDDNDKIL